MKATRSDSTRTAQPLRRYFIAITILVVLLTVVGIAKLIATLHPMPPRTITMATGPEGGSYAEIGKRYRALLARDGINLRLIPTVGGVENLKRLEDPHSGIDVGLVESGLTDTSDTSGIVSLGTLSYEPLWLFVRNLDANGGFISLKSLRNKKISIGPNGSSTRALALKLLRSNEIPKSTIHLLDYSPEKSADELLGGRIDAAVIVTAWESPVIHRLITAPSISLVNFARADAYVALFPFLNKLVVPAGVGDLGLNRPPKDVTIIAGKTSLVVREDLHPALQYLLLETAAQAHSGAGIFHKPGQFPAPESIEIPLSRHARQYYKSGRPFLQRYFPFWLAVLIEQIIILILPLIGVIYPLGKGLASLYGWGMQRRIFLIYGELSWLERELNKHPGARPAPELIDQFKQIEKKANKLRVSSAYMPMLYTMKDHLTFVRERLERRSS